MQDAINLFDKYIKDSGRVVLRGGGHISIKQAKSKAETEYAKFNEQRKIERYKQADKTIAELAREARRLPKRP